MRFLRERVYCYELYHLLRCALPDDYKYTLFGEVDKRGHYLFDITPGMSGSKPDFIVHIPGSMDYNLAIIEVKRIENSPNNFKDVVNKLKKYIDVMAYYRGILLIIGDDRHQKLKSIRDEISPLLNENLLVMWQSMPNNRIEEIF